MKYTVLLVVLCFKWRGSLSEEIQNKTKRGLIGQTDYISSFRPTGVYADNSGAPTQAQAQGLAAYYSPPKIVQPVPKPTFGPETKVTTQQVLYEYQQTPHNTVSNVHLQYQTIPQNPTDSTPQTQQIAYSQYVAQQPRIYPSTQQSYHGYPTAQVPVSAQYQVQPHFPPTQITPIQNNAFATAETVVNPVQHSALIHHPPIVGKYLYLNGKAAYQPSNHHLQQHPLQRPYINKQPQLQLQQQQKLTPPTYSSPLTFGSFQPIEKTTIKPVPVKEEPKKEEEEDDEKAEIENEDENEEVREEDDEEEEEERPRYREEEDFSRYYNDDEDEDRGNYREDDEEDDEDSRRGSSKYYHKKEPKRNYKHKSSYSTNKKYKSKPYKSLAKPPKYQAYKYTKGPNGKPKIETIEGKSSQNVPVTVQKVYREKWFITRNSNPQNEQ